MSLDLDAIRASLRGDWLLPALQQLDATAEVIFARQDGQQPAEPYATLLIAGIARRGAADERRGPDTDGLVKLTGTRRLAVSVNVFGPQAVRMAEHAIAYLGLSTVTAALRADGVVVYRSEDVQDLTGILDTGFQGRAQFDLAVGVVSELVETIDVIDGAVIGETVRDVDGVRIVHSSSLRVG